MKYLGVIAVSIVSLVVSACTSIPPGTTAVPADEIKSSLSGRTWSWPVGGPGAGIYFAPDGRATLFWQGKPWDTTWSARDGAFCYQHTSGDRCWAVYEKDGQVYSRSLWQAEHSEPYHWDPAKDTRRGRHLG